MGEVIAIINQKGGAGKTSTALALSAGAMRKGFKTLSVDIDPQCNMSYSMGADTSRETVLDLLTESAEAATAVQKTPQGDAIPATASMYGADAIITETGKEYRLREALEPIRAEYDYIILDAPPALGVLTVNALTAADSVIIPAQAEAYSLMGIAQLYNTIDTVRKYCNPGLTVRGILLTRYSSRNILSRDMREVISEEATRHGTRVFSAAIRENVSIKEAQARQQDIFTYAPRSNGAADYSAFINEIIPNRRQ